MIKPGEQDSPRGPGQDLQAFFDCHRRAFAHFGGVPMTIVYDRTMTVVRRHVAPGEEVPLHPEAVGFAGHYDSSAGTSRSGSRPSSAGSSPPPTTANSKR